MTRIDEISSNVFRISTFLPQVGMEFNQFLVRDEQPLLYHTGFKQMFPMVFEAVGKLIDPKKLRWVGFSHFEQDECGSLNEWLQAAPQAEPVCNIVSALVNLSDSTGRQVAFLEDGQIFSTGEHQFRFLSTPHVPHGWDASLLFEENKKILFCSDLFAYEGNCKHLDNNVLERAKDALIQGQNGPFANASTYNQKTNRIMQQLAELNPTTLANMHGSSYSGSEGSKILIELNQIMKEVLGDQ